MNPVLSVDNLNKSYKDITAVDNFHMQVFEGDIFGFLGPNGAGKSSTIRMLLSLVQPDSGNIRIFGQDFFNNRHEILSKIGALIERPDFYNYMSARKNLQLLRQD